MSAPSAGAVDPGADPDDEWAAAPTHPEAGGAEAGGGDSAATGDDGPDDEWGPAPPLPLKLSTARPKAERAPKPVKRQGRRRSQRGTSARGDRVDADSGKHGATDDRPPREPQVDRRPPTAEERQQIALKHAYRYLAKRDRTEAEVRTYLEKRETEPATLEAAIAELLELQYLDDQRYVQRYVEDRRRLDQWGPVRIAQGLRKIGIDNALIAPAIEAVAEESEDDDVDLATELVQRRFNRRPLDGDRDRQKALRAVVSKGHALDVAYAAVRAYEQRCAEDADG